jgi:hypothetical protein
MNTSSDARADDTGATLTSSAFFTTKCSTRLVRFLRLSVVSVWISLVSVASVFPQNSSALPHIRKQGTATQLIVHNQPFLMLGGELGNSSASDVKYMTPVWPKLKAMCVNAILMPVYWELIEPQEGRFDFSLTDELIASARKNDMKIVVLWFGSWKNSMSCYAPYGFRDHGPMTAEPLRFLHRLATKTGMPMQKHSAVS